MLGEGVSGAGIAPRARKAGSEAVLRIEGGRLRLSLPEGWTGSVRVFDPRGAERDPSGMDSAGSLWVYRLRARDRTGRVVERSGVLSPYSIARAALPR